MTMFIMFHTGLFTIKMRHFLRLHFYLHFLVLLTKCGPYKIYAAGLKTPD